MTQEFKNLINKDKNHLTPEELLVIFRLCKIKKNENTLLTDIVLLASPLVIILGIVNLFTPIFVSTFDIILNYLATIPACLNIAIKIRETIIKKQFMREFGLTRKEMKDILKSDQMKVFQELINDIKNDNFEVERYVTPDNTFTEFEFKDEEFGVDLTKIKERVEKKHRKGLIQQIIKQEKLAQKKTTDKKEDENINNV